MSAVFLDTVGLIALWDTSDQWHGAASTAFAAVKASNAPLVTTPFVLLECGNAAARRPYRSAVARLREQMEIAGAMIVPTPNDWSDAWAEYSRGSAGDAGDRRLRFLQRLAATGNHGGVHRRRAFSRRRV